MERSTVAWLILAAVLWGTTGTAQALGEAEGSPLTVGAIRLAIGSVGLLVFGVRSMARPPLRWLAVGSLAMAVYQVAFFSGVARAGVALGTVVAIGSSPVVAGILAWLSRGEVPNRRWWLATGLAVAGVALIAGRPDQVDLTGVGLALAAGIAYAVSTLASKHLLDVMTPTAAMAAMFGVAAILLAPLLPGADLDWITRPQGLAAALWLGLGATTASYIAFARGLRRSRVGEAATLALAEPATAAVLGVVILMERPPAAAIAGVALVGAGLLVLSARQRARAIIP